jgi:hypothetical protein
LSARRIDHDYDTASGNNNKVNPDAFERPARNRDAEDSDGNGVTNAVKNLRARLERTLPRVRFVVSTLLQGLTALLGF